MDLLHVAAIVNFFLNVAMLVLALLLRDRLREIHYTMVDSRRLLRLFEMTAEDKDHNGLGRRVVEESRSERGE